ncbi:spore germination protein [Paenibacillus doosanensis]|uniref:Spore germination protein n=1 Tax=Paenibacillus konkukensis TaxID=2020716 RepID=A0ABY4RF38_9BACL|nr:MULTISPECIES: endospore germination permease [Paenibacillus]MCS7462308.1 spore germination protein [Paenibacillus doosanensis]UQZ80880.1 Spore germination protein [Paenibacillus konkukensis]
MNANNGKITFLQAAMILMLMNGLTNHVIVNPMILDASGRDAWISVIVTAFLFFPWCLLVTYIAKKSGQQKLQPWLARQTNSFISWILIIPIALQLFIIGGLTAVHTTIWTITNYLPATPKIVLNASLVLVCMYPATIGIRAIAIGSGILLPTVVLLGIFVAVSNSPEKDYNLLKPILEFGWKPVMDGMLFAGGGFAELIVILVMQHQLKSAVKTWKFLILAFLMVYIMLGPLVGGITEFGPVEAAKQMISPYEQWRLVKLGNYFEHVDFLSVYQWLSGACVRISLALFLLADLMPLKKPKTRNRFIMGVSLCYILMSLVPLNQNDFYMWMYHFYFPGSLSVILVITIIWAVIALLSKGVKENRT